MTKHNISRRVFIQASLAAGGGLLKNFLHLLALVVAAGVAFIFFVPSMIQVIYGASLGGMLQLHAAPLAVGAAALSAPMLALAQAQPVRIGYAIARTGPWAAGAQVTQEPN